MRSHLDADILAPARSGTAAEAPQSDPGLGAEIRALIARLQRVAPEEPPALPRRAEPEPRRRRTSAVIDVPRERRGVPAAAVAVAQVAGFAVLLVAAVYGVPYYECSQMKKQGLFYAGTTVRSCVRDKVSARYDAAETFLQRAVRDL